MLSTVPIWQPLYIDNRSSALGLNPTPGQGTPICDSSLATEVCTTIIGVHISHSVQKYTLPWECRCTLPSTPDGGYRGGKARRGRVG